jgi:hypothetical protein
LKKRESGTHGGVATVFPVRLRQFIVVPHPQNLPKNRNNLRAAPMHLLTRGRPNKRRSLPKPPRLGRTFSRTHSLGSGVCLSNTKKTPPPDLPTGGSPKRTGRSALSSWRKHDGTCGSFPSRRSEMKNTKMPAMPVFPVPPGKTPTGCDCLAATPPR